MRNSLLSKITSAITIVAMVLVLAPINMVYAASVTVFKDTLSREKASTLSNHDITFVTPTGIAASATLILTFDNSTSIAAALDFTDIDLLNNGVDVTLAATPVTTTWGAVRTSATVITFTNGSTAVTAGNTVRIKIGTNATNQSTGVRQITNGTLGTTTLVLSGTFGDTGTASMSIVDDDQVTVTATVNQSITFDLDTYATATLNTETATPYSVPLGTLTTGAVTGSNESSINGIWFDLATNASGGATVSIMSSGGALKSTSVPTDTIPSATAAMAAGTANYGVCANRNATTAGTLTKVAPFASTCTTTPSTNLVGSLTTTAQTIYNTNSLPIAGGRGEIMVDAAISGVTTAHSDYSDIITLVAVGSY